MSSYRNFLSTCDMQAACEGAEPSDVPTFRGICDMLADCESAPAPPPELNFVGFCEMSGVCSSAPDLADFDVLEGAYNGHEYPITFEDMLDAANYTGETPIAFRVMSVANGTLRKYGAPVTDGVTEIEAGDTWIWKPNTAGAPCLAGTFQAVGPTGPSETRVLTVAVLTYTFMNAGAGLIGDFGFEEGTGTTANDASGAANHMTLTDPFWALPHAFRGGGGSYGTLPTAIRNNFKSVLVLLGQASFGQTYLHYNADDQEAGPHHQYAPDECYPWTRSPTQGKGVAAQGYAKPYPNVFGFVYDPTGWKPSLDGYRPVETETPPTGAFTWSNDKPVFFAAYPDPTYGYVGPVYRARYYSVVLTDEQAFNEAQEMRKAEAALGITLNARSIRTDSSLITVGDSRMGYTELSNYATVRTYTRYRYSTSGTGSNVSLAVAQNAVELFRPGAARNVMAVFTSFNDGRSPGYEFGSVENIIKTCTEMRKWGFTPIICTEISSGDDAHKHRINDLLIPAANAEGILLARMDLTNLGADGSYALYPLLWAGLGDPDGDKIHPSTAGGAILGACLGAVVDGIG